MSEKRAQVNSNAPETATGKHTVTIGLSLSRRSSAGHPDTTTRQTAFDFNELQDREYKYVSSTDSTGWRAGGGERGGGDAQTGDDADAAAGEFGPDGTLNVKPLGTQNHKVAAPDLVHIPIIQIDAESPQAVDAIIAALARGEVFIPHMSIIPESLSVDGVSPPDLVVRFGTERNDDLPPDEWPNWCLEFMHNQLYEYFQGMGARWMKRPFSITLAQKVRWKTVKHMNRYFSHAERVIDAWREKGPQYLDPQLAYIEGGATPEEVARPHGIYLLRNGIPTNYFAPNFDPPYTTKMTRSLLLNVLGKSWDKKRREWTSVPVPKLITPGMLVTAMCGCGDNTAGGFMANEVTLAGKIDTSTIPEEAVSNLRHEGPRTSEPSSSSIQQITPSSNSAQPPAAVPAKSDAGEVSEPVPDPREAPSSPPSQKAATSNENQQPASLPGRLSIEDPNMSDAVQRESSQEIPAQERPASPQAEALTNDALKDFSDELGLSMSTSTVTTSKSQASSSVLSSKYGRAPAPEKLLTPRPAGRSRKSEKSSVGSDGSTSKEAKAPANPVNASMDTGASSDYIQPSVTGSNSTIMHMNLSAEKFVQRELDRRAARDEKKEEETRQLQGELVTETRTATMASDEDWLDDIGKPIPSPAAAAFGQPLTTETKKLSPKEALDEERARQIALIAMAQQKTVKLSDHLSKTLCDPQKKELAEAVIQSEATDYSRSARLKRLKQPGIQQTNSGVSLEYSVDSTYVGDGASTLMGQQFATDTSVASTKDASVASTKDARQTSSFLKGNALTNRVDEEEALSEFSLQASTSSMEPVPTDEELFAVGWAKAMDPKSGSYYYFTLDRSQIVWDNPLSLRQASTDSMDSKYSF